MKQKRRPTTDSCSTPAPESPHFTSQQRPETEETAPALPRHSVSAAGDEAAALPGNAGGISLPPPPQPSRRFTGWAGGLDELEQQQTLPHPPQRAFRTNDDETIFEDQVLVGFVVAPLSAKETLDLYGIDTSYASYDQLHRRWTGCFFSEEVADMLAELTEEKEFPYPFEARPSWAELDWKVRQARGEIQGPEYAVYLYCEAASDEAIAAWTQKSGQSLIRRGAGNVDACSEGGNVGARRGVPLDVRPPTAWVAIHKGKKQ